VPFLTRPSAAVARARELGAFRVLLRRARVELEADHRLVADDRLDALRPLPADCGDMRDTLVS